MVLRGTARFGGCSLTLISLSGKTSTWTAGHAVRHPVDAVKRVARLLPRGWTLTDEAWRGRHRSILAVLWLHVPVVAVFGLLRGFPVPHVLLEAGGLALLAIFASTSMISRRSKTVFSSLGLMTASAVLVHMSGGSIEMHFHFFVMVPLVALYQDWTPFSVAIGFVALHHGIAGTIDPQSVFNHQAALNQPWKWAAIHALFITGISAVCLTTWALLESALKRAKDEARVKSEFLSVLTHEIRTPLTSVIGYTGLLADGDLSHEQRSFADVIVRNSDHLLTLINDILDYSKLEAGRLTLEENPFDVLHLMDDTIGIVADAAEKRGLVLSSVCENSVPRVAIGDSGRIAQVLLNLVSNAVKFTEHGEVVVRFTGRSLGDHRHELTIAVSDTGIGLDQDTAARLFDSFTQAEASTSRHYGGTGLGLAISRQLSHLMGGDIWVESVLGEGATFYATVVVGEGTPEPKRHETANSHLRVLVVGDEDKGLMEYLRHCDTAPRTATAAEALTWARTGQRFDVIMLSSTIDRAAADLAISLRALHSPRNVHIALVGVSNDLQEGKKVFDTVLRSPIRQSHIYDMLVSLVVSPEDPRDVASSETEKLADQMPLRLLVAEDNHVNQKVLLSQLRQLGYEADVVANGAEAIEAATLREYDVILMDVHMPDIDGITAARAIRDRSAAHRSTIVAVTADTTREARAACSAAGMDGYLTKPIKLAELAMALSAVVKKNAAA